MKKIYCCETVIFNENGCDIAEELDDKEFIENSFACFDTREEYIAEIEGCGFDFPLHDRRWIDPERSQTISDDLILDIKILVNFFEEEKKNNPDVDMEFYGVEALKLLQKMDKEYVLKKVC